MKKAAIVIGKPNSGKSTTIRAFMTLVKMEGAHKFVLNDKRGYILRTSFEEGQRDVEATVRRLSGYDLLVFACQGRLLGDVHRALEKASFKRKEVRVNEPREGIAKAKEIFEFFS